MSKSQPLKDIGKFVEGFVRDVPGKLVGYTQHMQARREAKEESSRAIGWEQYRPSDIEDFSKMAGKMTEKTGSELTAAQPKLVEKFERADVPWQRAEKIQEKEDMTAGQRDRIQGLYKTSHARLGAIKQGRLRPGAKKQTVLTKRKY